MRCAACSLPWASTCPRRRAIEYGLIAGLVAVAIIAALTALGTSLDGLFTGVSDTVSAAASS